MRAKALLIAVVLAGCGYRFTAPNSELPGGLRSVSVPLFVNRTAEPGAELTFTSAAKEVLSRAGRLGGSASDGELEGTITTITGGPMLGSPELGRQPVFRLSVGLNLVLKKQGQVLSQTSFVTSEEFPSGADVLLTEANRATALKRIADTALRDGLERLQQQQ